MSVNISCDGSPTPRKSSSRFSVHEDLKVDTSPEVLATVGVKRAGPTVTEGPQPLTTSKLGNQQSRTASRQSSSKKAESTSVSLDTSESIMDSLMARLSEQSTLLNKQAKVMAGTDLDNSNNLNPPAGDYDTSSSGSVPITPASDKFITTPTTDPDMSSVMSDPVELLRLKQELEAAKNKIARMDQELHASRITKSTLDQAMGTPSEADYHHYKGDITEQTISKLQSALNASTRPNAGRQESWPPQEDTRSETSEALSTAPFNRGQAIWGSGMRPGFGLSVPPPMPQQYPVPTNSWTANTVRPFYGSNMSHGMNPQAFVPVPVQNQQRPSSGHSRVDNYRGGNNQFLNEPTHFPLDQSLRRGMNPPSRPGSAFEPRYNQWTSYPPSIASADGAGGISPTLAPIPLSSMGMYPPANHLPYQPRPIGSMGTRLSPEAAEFSVDAMAPTPWNAQPNPDSGVTYVAPVEPMNYRRLLDRNMNCNWKYIVEKIVCSNDQQASIFLQQKLKVGTTEQKYEIVQAIIDQAYPLMVNRFGNFLVQRCFEHGTPEQVIAIANAIRGNTLTLSMDAFGCHVIQKAFDAVPEEYKAIMVHELLRRIPETVIHRYACHVWQKLFELRWSDSPPQIMKYVNEALRGMWHEVALGETGSLVVQNIFENCLEEDKRPCINEVLASIDVISHGQFGNWCIQHICEHGAPADRSRAIDHILRFATEYSMDQYASKVIEKCLKIGGNEFLDRYLERVCEGRSDRPRMPLIDIAGDQFGNYLVQYILTHCGTQHREIVATHVRKHMVSLRGSKYGSRVAMLCCNPAFATRPGPPAGMQLNRYNSNNSSRGAYGAAYR
ncbi:ARM repeat-containing protein [Lepidopterella palustris CBS 459.81]|uniref:ARM repeat-containing protein n=1 Tax=Lepidopterella palustris CBS 459.81 TaxID=1314670 RepID=A0A8E2EA85_9PEZI|nr:ARM repeat-containing protein [Lepidopterella palustris CBS 459.81]